ncbi:MAG: glycosyltransferase family 39 protein [Chitinophagales bacterium]
MKNKVYLKFLPFLLLYAIIFFLNLHHQLVDDEVRFWISASNITHGFYGDPSTDYGFLWNGPGYPIFIALFQFLKLPFNVPKAFNILFLFIAVIYVYKTLLYFLPNKRAYYIACAFGLFYPIFMVSLLKLEVEVFSIMLTSLFSYALFTFHFCNKKKYFWLASILLGYLILSKIFFAPVIIICLVSLVLFYIFSKHRSAFKSYIIMLFLGILFTFPYLAYTYSITGKVFYYSNAGGLSLYWMSTPYENETGDWLSFEHLPEGHFIKQNHKDFFNSIENLDPVEKDSALKKQAIENIRNHKVKYLKNIGYNIERLIIMMPTAFQTTKPSQHIIFFFPTIILFLLLVVSVSISLFKIKTLPPLIVLLMLLSIIYIGSVSLFSAVARYLHPIIPVLFIFISMVLAKPNKPIEK